jgi:putative nucleotidyltransferase with HDIG domain
MATETLPLIDVERLRPGVYVVLDLGWRDHPFALNRFTLKDERQLLQLRALGLKQVRWCPERSTAQPLGEAEAAYAATRAAALPSTAAPTIAFAPAPAAPRREDPLALQEAQLGVVEDAYRHSAQQHQRLLRQIQSDPAGAGEALEALASEVSAWACQDTPLAVRLLSPSLADQPSGHEIGVAALALLLGRDCGFSADDLRTLTLAALLHDVGKLRIPTFLHEDHGRLTEFERRTYRRHVELGVELAAAMGLPGGVLTAIGEHHENVDGSGFPAGLGADRLSPVGRVLALVNRYQNLVSPLHAENGLTPHRALQVMYKQERARHDPVLLPRLVRLLGVYPPGTLVELTDQRIAVVVATQPGMTLAPRVQILGGPDDLAPSLAIALDPVGGVGVRRGLPPEELNSRWGLRARQLARSAFYLQPVEQREAIAA